MKAVKLAVALTALAALGGVGAPAAVAAESLYAPDAAAREFNTSAGGWTGTVEADNVLCDLGLTCPAMFNRFEGSGGAAGDGFIRTEMAGLLGVSLLTAERGVWQSPRFTYRGAEGSQPTSVTLGFKRRTDDQTFLNVVGAAATFEARLRDLTSGTVLEAMPASDATDVSGWTAVPEATINPSQLVLGHEYVIEIVTETSVPVAVIPAATFDYDDVVLRATGPGGPGGSTRVRRLGRLQPGLRPRGRPGRQGAAARQHAPRPREVSAGSAGEVPGEARRQARGAQEQGGDEDRQGRGQAGQEEGGPAAREAEVPGARDASEEDDLPGEGQLRRRERGQLQEAAHRPQVGRLQPERERARREAGPFFRFG